MQFKYSHGSKVIGSETSVFLSYLCLMAFLKLWRIFVFSSEAEGCTAEGGGGECLPKFHSLCLPLLFRDEPTKSSVQNAGISHPPIPGGCGTAAGLSVGAGDAQPRDPPWHLLQEFPQELFPPFPLICHIPSEPPVACIPKHVTFYFHFENSN